MPAGEEHPSGPDAALGSGVDKASPAAALAVGEGGASGQPGPGEPGASESSGSGVDGVAALAVGEGGASGRPGPGESGVDGGSGAGDPRPAGTAARPDRTADVLLADGAPVRLRPIEPSDAEAIVALHARFSERTRYLRYFAPYPRIPERDLHRFVNVDHRDREAFVVALGEQLIAVGRYERLGPAAEDAEVAFVVEDAHQGRGVGSVLLEHLAAAARQEGVARFVAEVLPENGAMLRVFADAGYQVERRYADGVVHLTFPIAPTARSRQVRDEREHRTEARSLARLLAPRAVAVYGASTSGQGTGAALLAHLRDAGYTGRIYPVHPSAGQVAGLPARRSLAEVTEPVDLAVVAVPPEAVAAVVAEAAAAGVHGLVVVSAGFAEAGPAGLAAQRDLLVAARAAGLRLVGPNCFGVANTDRQVRLNATLAPRLPPHGRVGFFCQSGALGVALLAEASRRGLGLSSFVSAGNRADVSGNDLLQYWEDDPGTDVVLLYLETFGNPRKFARLARRVGRTKPVVAVGSPARRAGGALAGGVAADESSAAAFFAHSGVIRVATVAELFDVGILLAHQPLPAGSRVGVVTNSVALGWLAVAACREAGLSVAEGYPVQATGAGDPVTGAAGRPAVAGALAAATADPAVDAVVVAIAPPLPGDLAGASEQSAAAVAGAVRSADKPVVAAFLAGELPERVPCYPSVEEAVRALARVTAYARWRRQPLGTVPELARVRPDEGRAALLEPVPDAGALLRAYGVEVVPSTRVASADEAVAAAEEYGYPVVLKADGGLRNRLDLGAVRLDLADADAVRRACQEVCGQFGTRLLVQKMVAPGVACVVEMADDPAFGPVVGFGLGGVATELLRDRAWRPAPLTDRDAAALVAEVRAAPLLHGHRGTAPVDLAALRDLLLRVGRLADDRPEIGRLVLDPVLARPDGVSVLHASVRVGGAAPRPDSGPRRL